MREELSSLPQPKQLEDMLNNFKEISSQLLANVRDSHTAKTPVEKQAIFDQIYNHIGQGRWHIVKLEEDFQKLRDTATRYSMEQFAPSFKTSKSELSKDIRSYRASIAETQFKLEDNIKILRSELPASYHPYYSLEQVTHSERIPEEWTRELSDARVLNGCGISCTVYACLKFNIKYDVSDIQKALSYTPEHGSMATAMSEASYAKFGLGGQLRYALPFDTVRQETERGNIVVARLHKPGMPGHATCIEKVQDTDKGPQFVIWDPIKPESLNTIPAEIIQNLSKGLQKGTLRCAILSPLSAHIP